MLPLNLKVNLFMEIIQEIDFFSKKYYLSIY